MLPEGRPAAAGGADDAEDRSPADLGSWRSDSGQLAWSSPWRERRAWFWRLIAWKTYAFVTCVSLLQLAVGLLTDSRIVVWFHGVLSACLAVLTVTGYLASRPRVPWHTGGPPPPEG